MRTLSKKFVVSNVKTEYTKPADILMVFEDDLPVETSISYEDETSDINNVYVAHVNDVVKNIEAAFLEYEKGKIGYLSLKEIKNPVFINNKNTTKVCEGDNILVQLIKEPIKTKYGVLSTNISFSGKYIVFCSEGSGISVSKKIPDKEFSKDIAERLSEIASDCSFIVRTQAYNVSFELIYQEAINLKNKYKEIVDKARYRTAYSVMHRAEDASIAMIKELYSDGDEIISDNELFLNKCADDLKMYYNNVNTRLYNDKLLPLDKLYNFQGILKEISSTNIWLKSGAYIVIEHTEAMTVIDVNTGKCIKGKNSENTFLSINLEAGKEILRQLRLRNISGIIMCDFINMESEKDDQELIKSLKMYADKDRLKVNIVGLTKLKLMEITRKKVKERIILKK